MLLLASALEILGSHMPIFSDSRIGFHEEPKTDDVSFSFGSEPKDHTYICT